LQQFFLLHTLACWRHTFDFSGFARLLMSAADTRI
jgi:hypothetical protein